MNKLKIGLEKMHPSLDNDYYYERITSYPESQWLTITNNGSQDYDIFSQVYNEYKLIEMKCTPIWVDGSFRGNRVCFRYKLDLQYTV